MRQLYDTLTGGAAFRRLLLAWYRGHGRDLPWRRTRDPYAILVSEVMLQQTQVSRVATAYGRFLRRFPTLATLARASLAEVLREWSGLGYNRRARDLHRVARASRGALPLTVSELDALPGIGAYTAGAVACFAYGVRAPFADTNIRRVLGRAFLGRTATEREASAIDGSVMARDAASWHHALMDIGALFCIRRAPRCDVCPVRPACRYRGGEVVRARTQQPFASSDRRVRGAIVRALVSGPRTVRSLARELSDARVPPLVEGLIAEGLVESVGRRVALPG